MMKTIGIIIVLLSIGVIFLCVGYFCLLPENSSFETLSSLPTSIRVKYDTLTLGVVKYGEERQASFLVCKPLLIRDVRPSCGCTDVKWLRKPVAPGETTEISIVFKPVSLGRFMKSIDVLCNIAQHSHRLYLRGEVVE